MTQLTMQDVLGKLAGKQPNNQNPNQLLYLGERLAKQSLFVRFDPTNTEVIDIAYHCRDEDEFEPTDTDIPDLLPAVKGFFLAWRLADFSFDAYKFNELGVPISIGNETDGFVGWGAGAFGDQEPRNLIDELDEDDEEEEEEGNEEDEDEDEFDPNDWLDDLFIVDPARHMAEWVAEQGTQFVFEDDVIKFRGRYSPEHWPEDVGHVYVGRVQAVEDLDTLRISFQLDLKLPTFSFPSVQFPTITECVLGAADLLERVALDDADQPYRMPEDAATGTHE